MHKNPSSGKRSTQPFGEEGFFGKCVGSNILKVDTFPRRDVSLHLFGERCQLNGVDSVPRRSHLPTNAYA